MAKKNDHESTIFTNPSQMGLNRPRTLSSLTFWIQDAKVMNGQSFFDQ